MKKDARACLTVIDPKRPWRVDRSRFASLSRNTPFEGREMTGCAVLTLVDGRVVYNNL